MVQLDLACAQLTDLVVTPLSIIAGSVCFATWLCALEIVYDCNHPLHWRYHHGDIGEGIASELKRLKLSVSEPSSPRASTGESLWAR